MSEVRLDAATARSLLRCVSRLRDECLAAADGAGPSHLSGIEVGLTAVGLFLARLEIEAESRPPALSDWVRACEGTALGDPTEGLVDGNFALFFSEHMFVELRRNKAGSLCANVNDVFDCSTPAELHAALERLATEAKP